MLNELDWRDPRIKTQSLWLTDRGDFAGLSTKDFGMAKFHGRYHPEIPYQMMLRYTRQDDWVWDPFAGGGTTIDVGKLMGRNVVASDLTPVRADVVEADCTLWHPNQDISLVMLHPPYWKMLKFSEKLADLSNAPTAGAYVQKMSLVLGQIRQVLRPKGWVVLVISDVYTEGEQHPLGTLLYPEFVSFGFRLKGKIIKDFGETKGTAKSNPRTRNLWRYRMVKYGFWELGLDEIWVYQSVK